MSHYFRSKWDKKCIASQDASTKVINSEEAFDKRVELIIITVFPKNVYFYSLFFLTADPPIILIHSPVYLFFDFFFSQMVANFASLRMPSRKVKELTDDHWY